MMNRPSRHALSLFPLLTLALALGACSSSDDDGGGPADDAPGGGLTGGDGTGADGGDIGGTDGGAADAGGTTGTGTGGTGTDGSATGGADGGTDTGGTGDGGGGGAGSGLLGSVPSSAPASSFGFVQLEQPSAGDGGSLGATFYSFDQPFPAGDLVTEFVPALDTCTVTRTSTTGGIPDFGDVPDIDFEFESLDAGETLTFTSPAGTWLTLPRQELFGFLIYASEDDLPTPIPSGLELDIPGGGQGGGGNFPAFASVPLPDVTRLSGVSTDGASVTPETEFRWDAGNGAPGVFVRIDLFAFDITAGSATSVDCVVRDDGEFSLPAATRSELGAAFSSTASLTRFGVTALQRDGALLFVTHESSSD